MRSYGIRIFILLLSLCMVFPLLAVNAASDAISINASCDGDAYYGGEITVRISVSKPTVALAGLEFTLSYDPAFVRPFVTENSEDAREMDELVTAMPNGWEQMSNHSEGLYHFRFAGPDGMKDLLDNAGELVLEVRFAVVAAGSFTFDINSNDIIAVANDSESSVLSGEGTSLTVVAGSEAQKLAISIDSAESASEKGKYLLALKATNLGDKSGIIAVEFALQYDKTVFSPTVTDNKNGEMDSFMTDMPGSWEQMCSFDSAKGIYTLRFVASNAESVTNADKLASGESFTVTIPFNVIGAEGGIAEFSVSATTIIGVNSINGILAGRGSSKSVSIEKAPEVTVPDELGYTVRDGYLLYVYEKTETKDFLAPFASSMTLERNGVAAESGYVCTGDILTDRSGLSLTVVVLGDAASSGTVDKFDYIIVKRQCLGTIVLEADQLLASDATLDGKTDKYDYILIKRHCLGTFTIGKDN